MSYSTATIAKTLDRLNRSFFLPAIQRPFVWEPDQIASLFDSLMKGYPISSFLFWDLKQESRKSWDIYKFVENFRFGSTHNEIAEIVGQDLVLVLDGQQRLTSLLIGLRGSYTSKRKHKRKGNPNAWDKQHLYLNLFCDPALVEDPDATGGDYEFRFFSSPPVNTGGAYWLRLSEIMAFSTDDEFDRFKDSLIDQLPPETTRGDERIFRRNLERLYRVVWKEESISFYTELNQSPDRVLNIFIRANDGGTKLSKSDLLLSMITANWNGVNAREEIFQFVDILNEELGGQNDFDKDFVMKSLLVLTGLDVKYKVSNFTSNNLALIQSQWGKIRAALAATIRLINRLGIDASNLTSTNAVMPIAYYLYATGLTLDGSTPFEEANAQRIHKWLTGALLNGVFGGSSDRTIAKARSIIDGQLLQKKEFPIGPLVERLRELEGRTAQFNDESIDAILETTFKDRRAFLALSLLYDDQNWGAASYHIDHIIPRSACDPMALVAAGLSQERIEAILASLNKIGNLEILIQRENLEKSNRPFEQWMTERDAKFLQRHLIPTDSSLWCAARLPEFVQEREKLIRQRILTLMSNIE